MRKPNFPYNLIKDIIGTEPTEPMPADIVGTVYYMIHTLLNEKQIEVIIRYYTTEASLNDVADAIGRTQERTRQIRADALRHLRNINTRDMLNKGLSAFYENEKEAAAKYAYNKGRGQNSSDEPASTEKYKKFKNVQDSICNMNLSVRVAGCLKRAGINTVCEIIDAGPVEIYKINGMGQKGYDELIKKLVNDYGEDINNWTYPFQTTEKSKNVHDPIYKMNLSTRTFNALNAANIKTVSDIISAGPAEIVKVSALGKKGYNELVEKLVSDYGENSQDWTYSAPSVKKNTIIYKWGDKNA